MPRKYSLRYRRNFNNLYRFGKRLSSRYFYALYLSSSDLKFAVSVPKKLIKKAVRRNYSKRLVRELLRGYLKCNVSLSPHHVLIKPKFDLMDLKRNLGFKAIRSDMYFLLDKIFANNKQSANFA